MLEASKNPDVLYLVIEKLQFNSKVMLQLCGKYFDGTFVEKQSSGKLKSSMEHTKILTRFLVLENLNTLKYSCSVVTSTIHYFWN